MPKLSIITINLNNKIGLQKTIESVVNQSSTGFEYLVIDGASTDGSLEVLKQHANKIDFWISEPDRGIFNAMNKGIARATGDYCLFLNSGDYLVESVLGKILPHLDNAFDICYGDLIIADKEGNFTKLLFPDVLRFSFLVEKYLPHPASFIKTSLFSKVGPYNESFRICSDWEFFLKSIVLHNCTTSHISAFVSYYPLNGVSSIHYDTIGRQEKQKIMTDLFPLFEQDYHDLRVFRENNAKPLVRWATLISNSWISRLFRSFFRSITG